MYIRSPSHFLCSVSFVCFPLCQILHPLIHMKPSKCFLSCLFSPLTGFIFFLSDHSFVTLSEFSVYSAAVSSSFLINSLLFGIRSPSCCLQSVTVPCSHVEFRNRETASESPTLPWSLCSQSSFSLSSKIYTCSSPWKSESQFWTGGPRTAVDPENSFNLSLSH